jgi:predicted ATPase
VNVVTGPNGSGKSNVYRALRLLGDCARVGAGAALAAEGGLSSALWAGAPSGPPGPIALRLGYGGDDFGYAIDLGLPIPGDTMFGRDPEIKVEAVWGGPLLRPGTIMVERRGPVVRARPEGQWELIHDRLRLFDSVLSEIADFQRAPELIQVREEMRAWRFYDHFRVDPGSAPRAAQIGSRTPVLDNDGASLAAAWQTIVEVGDADSLHRSIDEAFPGTRVHVRETDGRFELIVHQPGLSRPLHAAELSDGTLRFVLMAVALLSPRPPELLVLNEPETSLHPDLIPALANLIARSAAKSQVVAVTHSPALVDRIADLTSTDPNLIELYRDDDGTHVLNQEPLDEPAWHFPER